jgi:hypothetical protein
VDESISQTMREKGNWFFDQITTFYNFFFGKLNMVFSNGNLMCSETSLIRNNLTLTYRRLGAEYWKNS